MTANGFFPAEHVSGTGHAGTYRRRLPVELARLYENALDWEHLPWVHPGSFRSIECLGLTADSWRARTVSPQGGVSVIDLALDRDSRRWVTRVLEGEGAGNEIWTHVFIAAPPRGVDIVVDFFLPTVPAEKRAAAGAAYGRLYARLYDEDVDMMVERARQLDRRIGDRPAAPHRAMLGLRERLELPATVTLGGRDFRVVETAGALRAFPAVCPHQLGPLGAGAVANGVVTCPWHGYQFDLQTGRALGGQLCQLQPLPAVEIASDGTVTVTLTA